MGCVGETDKDSSSWLRSIHLYSLRKLREVWRIKDGGNNLIIQCFEAVESIRIDYCERFEDIITPATTNIEMRALKQVVIMSCGGESERNDEMVESKQDQGCRRFENIITPATTKFDMTLNLTFNNP
ncbi:hypothetical protein Tco_1490193, partial [Tanacetum coccineum]